jgi:hypothetical protein
MSNGFLNWSGRADIEGRVTERRRPQNRDESTTPGDCHLPFAKAQAKAAKWVWQAYLI